MAFDIGGRIVLEDAFSASFDALSARSNEAEKTLSDVGSSVDAIGEGGDFGSLQDQLRQLSEQSQELKESLSGYELDVDTDLADLGLESVQERIAGLRDSLQKAQAAVRDGAVITPEGMQAYQQAQAEVARLQSGLAAMTGESDKANESILALVKGVGALAVGGIALKQIWSWGQELTRLGAAAVDTARAFEVLAETRGIDSDRLIGGLVEAAHGAVSSGDLMLATNRAIISGGEELAEKLPRLFESARASAMIMGTSSEAAFEGIVRGVSYMSERALRTQGIIVDLSAANEAWAKSNNRTVESLTDVERRLIAADAAIEATSPLVKQLGLDSATASEQMQSLPIAIDNVKESLGKVLVEAGAADLLAQLAQNLNELSGAMGAEGRIRGLREELEALGETDAANRLKEEAGRIRLQANVAMQTAWFPADVERVQSEQAAALADLAQKYEVIVDNAEKLKVGVDVWNLTHGAITQSVVAADAYQEILDDITNSLTGTSAVQNRFAQQVAAGAAALASMPDTPDMSAAMDVSKLREWGDAWAAVTPGLDSARASLEQTAVAIENHQRAVLADAMAIDDIDERLLFLTQALFGSGASIDKLVQSLSDMPPELLAAIGPADDLGAALARLKAATDQTYAIRVTMEGYAAVASSIEDLALRMAKLYGPEKARQFYDAALSENRKYWQDIDVQDGLGARMAQQEISGALGAVVKEAEDSFSRVQKAGTSAFDGIASSAGELRSKVERALSGGLEVTAEDMAATLAGTYEDAPLEAARRLDAIAARGFAELQAHPDWAALLKIPPEVLSGTEEQLKAWAASTSADVKALERPDLIDWDAFAKNFEDQLNKEAAKEQTIKMGIEVLEGKGLLKGSQEEREKAVAKALGIDYVSMDIEAMFKTSPTAKQDMINEITGGTGVVEFDAVMNVTKRISETLVPPEETITAEDRRWLKATEEDEETAVDTSKMFNVESDADALQVVGKSVVEQVKTGIEDSIDMTKAVLLTAQSITSGAKQFEKELNAAGRDVGGKILAGIEKTVTDGAPDIIDKLATAIAPSVAAKLAADARRAGEHNR